MKIRNINPHTDGVYLAAIDADVAAGEIIDVDAELGAALCEQPDNWAEVKTPKTATKGDDQ